MSDFSNLLNQLQQTAQAQAQSNSQPATRKYDSNTSSSTPINRRRGRITSSSSEKQNSHNDTYYSNSNKKHKRNNYDYKKDDALPRDHRDLTVSLSFLCIGAQKAGTTWLHEMLQNHSQVALPIRQKELHFWDWHRSKGLGWYSRQFPSHSSSSTYSSLRFQSKHHREISKPPRFYGEITPCYAVLPSEDIQEIKCLFPKVKIIFFARDLLERTWSALLMELYQNVKGLEAGEFADKSSKNHHDNSSSSSSKSQQQRERRSKQEQQMLLEEANPENFDDDYFLERMEHSTHYSRSDYATALRNWLKEFSKDNLLIVDYRNVSIKPKEVLEHVCQHIIPLSSSNKTYSNATEEYLSSLTNEQLCKRINAAIIKPSSNDSSSSTRCPIRPSLERKMKKFLRPMAQDFNGLLKELGYDWSLDEYPDCI